MIIGCHVCEVCGRVYETIGDYLNCQDSHTDAEIAAVGMVRK